MTHPIAPDRLLKAPQDWVEWQTELARELSPPGRYWQPESLEWAPQPANYPCVVQFLALTASRTSSRPTVVLKLVSLECASWLVRSAEDLARGVAPTGTPGALAANGLSAFAARTFTASAQTSDGRVLETRRLDATTVIAYMAALVEEAIEVGLTKPGRLRDRAVELLHGRGEPPKAPAVAELLGLASFP